MIIKSREKVLLEGDSSVSVTHLHNPAVINALAKLQGHSTRDEFPTDQTGLGKTVLILLYLAFFTHFHIEVDGKGHPFYRPSILIVPATLVRQ